MFNPVFKVIAADSVEDAMKDIKEGEYEAVLVVGIKAKSLPEVPLTRQFVKDGIAKLLSDILVDLTTHAGGRLDV